MEKIYRKFIEGLYKLNSMLRVLHYNFLAAGIIIDFKTYIGPGTQIKCSNNSTIRIENSAILNGVVIIADHGANIAITDSYIGYNSVLVAREGISIRKNCQIAEMVVIRDQNHRYGNPDKTIVEQGFESSPILIDENVWIASKATILKGVTIGKNAVIGAFSLVNQNVEPDSVNVGIPARKL